MDLLTTTIRREPLREIIAGRKKIEYREIKPYWIKRLASVKTPFLLQLINGMSLDAPRATMVIHKIRENRAHGVYELHISEVTEVRHWDKKKERPK